MKRFAGQRNYMCRTPLNEYTAWPVPELFLEKPLKLTIPLADWNRPVPAVTVIWPLNVL